MIDVETLTSMRTLGSGVNLLLIHVTWYKIPNVSGPQFLHLPTQVKPTL